MKLSVIVPVHNGADDLRECLRAVGASTRPPHEVIVADDASTDTAAHIAAAWGARVVEVKKGPRGPAYARNRAAEAATGDILVFFDADVRVHPDTLTRIEEHFEAHPDIAALFGSYDDTPTAPNLISRYCNLRHHYVHQHSEREAWTFWSGCGAVRRACFEALGGFDETYATPSVEDIAFGRVLRDAGYRIHLCPAIQVTHLKRWTLASWLHTDIWRRAVPWTRMLLAETNPESNIVRRDLNLDWSSRIGAVAAWLTLVFGIAGLWHHAFWMLAGGTGSLLLACNWPLVRCFARQGGAGFALGAGLCHALYLLYSSAIFGSMALAAKCGLLKSQGARLPTTATERVFRRGFALLLLATASNGVLWSLLDPPWQAPDEPQHFLYAHAIAEQHHWRMTPTNAVPDDVHRLAILTLRYRLPNGKRMDWRDEAAIRASIAALDAPTAQQKRVPSDSIILTGTGFVLYHPPLFYGVVALVTAPFHAASVRSRVLVGRWLCVLLGVCTVAFSVLIGREVWPTHPERGLALGALVAFQPVVTFTFATITNEALETALFTLLLYLGLRTLREPMTLPRGIAIGLVLAAGTFTKMSFCCAALLLGGIAAWRAWRGWRVWHGMKHSPRRASSFKPGRFMSFKLGAWLPVLVLPVLLCGSWYRHTLGGSLSTVGSSLVQRSFGSQRPAISRSDERTWQSSRPLDDHWGGLRDAANLWRRLYHQVPLFQEAARYLRVLRSYWGAFGWFVVWLPLPLWIVLAAGTLGAAIAAGRRLLRRPSSQIPTLVDTFPTTGREGVATRRQQRALWWLAGASVALLAFYAFVDWRNRHVTGGAFDLRGQYYLPAIAGQMAWLFLGVGVRRGWWLAAGMIALNAYCVFGLMGPVFYETTSPGLMLHRAALWQPVSAAALGILCLGTGVLIALFLASLWKAATLGAQRHTSGEASIATYSQVQGATG